MTGDDGTSLAARYRSFADVEAERASPLYAAFARGIAADADVLAFLAELPAAKRQPNLLLAAVRYLHGTAADYAQFRRWVLADRPRLRATILARATQTNEAARCAALLPLLAGLPGPLTLIEVGASAGLCLYPDRYSYDYEGTLVGRASSVHLTCTTSGAFPVPRVLPEVVARIGIDLNPLDPADPAALAWLQALVWPGPFAADRIARLNAAAELAAAEPTTMLTGDLLECLPDAVAAAPADSTVVVFHTSVLAYLPAPARAAFGELVRSLPVRWIAQEDAPAIPGLDVTGLGGDSHAEPRLVLALDGCPVARTAPHGGHIDWLAR